MEELYKDLNDIKLLSKDENDLLAADAKTDENKMNELFRHNYRIVFNVANKYRDRGVDFDDLIQEGCLAFVLAVKNYDRNLSGFSTYATIYADGYIQRYIKERSGNIKLTHNFYDKRRDYTKMQEDGTMEKLKYSDKRIVEAHAIPLISIDAIEEEGKEFDVPSPDRWDENLINEIAEQEYRDEIAKIVKRSVTEREFEILSCVWGLDGVEPVNLSVAAKHLHLSRQGVGHTYKRAIKKIQLNRIMEVLKSYV